MHVGEPDLKFTVFTNGTSYITHVASIPRHLERLCVASRAVQRDLLPCPASCIDGGKNIIPYELADICFTFTM